MAKFEKYKPGDVCELLYVRHTSKKDSSTWRAGLFVTVLSVEDGIYHLTGDRYEYIVDYGDLEFPGYVLHEQLRKLPGQSQSDREAKDRHLKGCRESFDDMLKVIGSEEPLEETMRRVHENLSTFTQERT